MYVITLSNRLFKMPDLCLYTCCQSFPCGIFADCFIKQIIIQHLQLSNALLRLRIQLVEFNSSAWINTLDSLPGSNADYESLSAKSR